MLECILVPLDGSPQAECVLPHAIAIARAFNANIVLVHVVEQPISSLRLPQADPLDCFLQRSTAQVYMDTVQSRLQALNLTAQVVILEGNAAEKIVEQAYSTRADLLILSGYGETRDELCGVSSIAQQILQRVRISTLIIRTPHASTGYADDLRYQRLLVPLDGSQRAGSALTMAAAFASAYQSETLLVHVVSKPEMARHMPLSYEEETLVNQVIERNQEEGRRYLDQTQARLPANTQSRLLISDNVAATIQSVVEHEQIDLLILTAHGYSGEATWPYGSITNRFITNGTTALLIIQDLERESSDSECSNVETRQPNRIVNAG